MAETKDPALLLAELAHELRQPLTGIRANAELLLDSHGGDATVRSRAAAIVQQVQRIQLLLDRARRPGPPPPGTRGDLNQAVEAAWSLLEADAARQGATLERKLGKVPQVACDQIALEQTFGNLLRNAMEALGSKGGRIRVTTATTGGGAEAIVEDEGAGIPAELRARLFSPFVTGRASGTGLGLYICRSLAEEAGGELDLLEGGPGARFRLRLPLAR
ncbi:MAG: HAMP domain-containing histidine kinase [Deltaproteobacteria bacterium]|nr:MAG: HAMP domain-containing histidine kinase [Deltaproteobacteria bacterium]